MLQISGCIADRRIGVELLLLTGCCGSMLKATGVVANQSCGQAAAAAGGLRTNRVLFMLFLSNVTDSLWHSNLILISGFWELLFNRKHRLCGINKASIVLAHVFFHGSYDLFGAGWVQKCFNGPIFLDTLNISQPGLI
jgi:hypothetical protein